ncbi:hypothetical protein A7P95_03130 [Eikenella longinqua]|uniref:Uncharacterized protein n=1 Tax=Eikenella longinqua TaxID=1795827 RepID=A0A1A9S0F8_9NEIS|nr:hypothetical protein A7P95_03130 [Eikenella longinqua]
MANPPVACRRFSHFGTHTAAKVAATTSTIPSHDSAEIRSPNTHTAKNAPKIGSKAVRMPEKLADTVFMPLFHKV